jgi:nucleotide-binding universal stress UspA family protein
VDRAVALAALDPEVSLTLMHVHEVTGLGVIRQMLGADAEEMERTLASDAEGQLTSLVAECERLLERKVHARFSQGIPDTEILDAATRLAVDLVVMGERGRTPARSPFLGGTIDRVFRKANCSVLAAKAHVSGPYERILVGVGSWRDSRAVAQIAAMLNPGAEVILLHAFEAPFVEKFRHAGATDNWINQYRFESRHVAESELEKLATHLGEEVRTRRVAVEGSPAPALVDFGSSVGADLIVVGKHRKSVFGDLLFGNIARRVAAESRIDVLVASSQPD